MSQQDLKSMSFFRRLAKDATANTLAISAASLVPVMAMIGGGVDASRYYMAESRLQAACDAGALAARRAMAGNNFSQSAHGTIGDNFFVNNFATGQFGTTNLTQSYSGTNDGEVLGSADAKLPTTIMGAFGFEEFDLNVTCQADINISDTDVMMVLDITGSMRNRADGSSCGSSCSDSRIDNLRSAVESFYTIVDQTTSDGAQVRYGFVPYAAEVNLRDVMQPQWMADTFTYSTRRGLGNIGTVLSQTNTSTSIERTGGAISGSFTRLSGLENVEAFVPSIDDCRDIFFDPPDGPPTNNNRYVRHDLDDLTLVSDTINNGVRVREYTGPVTFLALSASNGTYNSGSDRCNMFFFRDEYLAEATVTITDEEERAFVWEYGRLPVDVAGAYGGPVTTNTGHEFANETHNWNGCILHNTIDNNIDPGDFDPIPAGAHDINIDLVPSSDDEKWGPSLPSLVRMRYPDGLSSSHANWQLANLESEEDKPTIGSFSECPTVRAQKLREVSSLSEITTYLSEANGFKPGGTTIHNVGLLWGGRMISPDGIFASENAAAPGGNAISRHLIFMTDGEMTAQVFADSAYGPHQLDQKIRPDSDRSFGTVNGNGNVSTTAVARHNARLQAICTAIRNKNITLWVVAFGETFTDSSGDPIVPPNLLQCATPGRAFAAANSSQLEDRFEEIAKTIAALRLTK
ncbi:MAG: pilus assembly protein TadG-related protein [Erythrobacter sp.]|uniref:TadE/TadG family type IV pilus assembly protein n=1 Tax=Erythrobacter sp. TaxID=1042 RepID=UPI003262D202